MRAFIRCATLCFVLLGRSEVASSQNTINTHPLTGDWDAIINLDGLAHALTFSFDQTPTHVSGTLYDSCWVARDNACAEDGSTRLEDLSVTNDTLRFAVGKLQFTGVMHEAMLRLTLENGYDGTRRAFVAVHRPNNGEPPSRPRRPQIPLQ